MEWIETTGRTADEAKQHALEQLGVSREDADIEVVEQEQSGFLGLGRKDARVRARVRPEQVRSREGDGRQRSGSGKRRRRGGRKQSGSASGQGGSANRQGGSGGKQGASDAKDRNGRRSAKAEASDAKPPKPASKENRVQKETETVSEPATMQEQADVVGEFLEGLVAAFGYEATIRQEQTDEDTITVHVEGEGLGLLVGQKGSTLRSVQELARTVVQRQCEGRHEGRVRVDIAGYWERRREALEGFTRRLAGEVVESGVAKALEPMGAADRKVVHDAAVDIAGVSTVSEGEDPNRRVVLVPDTDAE